jgi:hypothetical protein
MKYTVIKVGVWWWCEGPEGGGSGVGTVVTCLVDLT